MAETTTPQKKEETIIVVNGPPGVVKGYLEDFTKADIVVNSAPSSMVLTQSGKVSLAILERAGTEIQAECSQKFPNGIKNLEVVHTSAYRLPYSSVFHCTVQLMDDANSFTQMAQLIKNCLQKADGMEITDQQGDVHEARTIAFPLLGTGAKQFSPDICRVFYRTMLSFFLGPTKSLQNAYIIVTPKDQHLIKVIQDLKPYAEFQATTHELCLPYTWQAGAHMNVITLSDQSREFEKIKREFEREAPMNSKLKKIERVQNLTLYKEYLAAKCEYKMLEKSNEKKLWFVCNTSSVTGLYSNGLNQNFKKSKRCGNGYYFYETSNLADDMRENRDVELKVVYCSVGIGARPIPGNHVYDVSNFPATSQSAVDNVHGPTMYAIFKEKLFYPEYVVTYETQ